MIIDDVIDHFGGHAETMKALGINKQTLSNWKFRGIPKKKQFMIQEVTSGKVTVNNPGIENDLAIARLGVATLLKLVSNLRKDLGGRDTIRQGLAIKSILEIMGCLHQYFKCFVDVEQKNK